MGHTNEAAKQARTRMFSMIAKFGVPAIFFTITPDDNGSFRIKINAHKASYGPPDVDACPEDIRIDAEVARSIREQYPGLCDFDFENILGLVINHLIGWDEDAGIPKEKGGVFGVPDAWSAAIEEQGRKTLHVHFLIWIKDWSSLLDRLRSDDKEGIRKQAGEELQKYVDNIMSTKLHGNLPLEARKKACAHSCLDLERETQEPTHCSPQDLRNLRYKDGVSSIGGKNIGKCEACGTAFTSEALVSNVINGYLPCSDVAEQDLRMSLAAKRVGAGLSLPETFPDFLGDFMTNASKNLHRSEHAMSCFKKGSECRFCNPQMPCNKTVTIFDINQTMKWTCFSGKQKHRDAFYVKLERDPFDVFVNTHHPQTSKIIGCNTNVQCGIDGGHIMYSTTYQTKSTQAEDSRKYATVGKSICYQIKRYEESVSAAASGDASADCPTPFAEGYRRLLASVLVNTGAHVVSAPLARYIVMNGSRFRYSHDFAHVPLAAFLDKPFAKRVKAMGDNTYFEDQMKNYLFRSDELMEHNLLDFVSEFDVRRMSKKDKEGNGDAVRFSSDGHPNYKIEGIFERDRPAVPLVSFLDFPDASKFDGHDMLACEGTSVPHFDVMDEYAKSALFLLQPFINKGELIAESDGTYLTAFRNRFFSDSFRSHDLRMLQNIQDCYNMLQSGRVEDELTRTTVPLADDGKVDYEKQQEDQEAERYVREVMTEAAAFLGETVNGNSEAADPQCQCHCSML